MWRPLILVEHQLTSTSQDQLHHRVHLDILRQAGIDMDGESTRIIFSITAWSVIFFFFEPGCVCNETSGCCFLLESAFHLRPPAAQALYVCIHVDKQKHIYKGIGSGIRR